MIVIGRKNRIFVRHILDKNCLQRVVIVGKNNFQIPEKKKNGDRKFGMSEDIENGKATDRWGNKRQTEENGERPIVTRLSYTRCDVGKFKTGAATAL